MKQLKAAKVGWAVTLLSEEKGMSVDAFEGESTGGKVKADANEYLISVFDQVENILKCLYKLLVIEILTVALILL